MREGCVPVRRLWGIWCWLAGHDEINFQGLRLCWRCGRALDRERHGYHAIF